MFAEIEHQRDGLDSTRSTTRKRRLSLRIMVRVLCRGNTMTTISC